MSWTAARDRMVTIIEAVIPGTQVRGKPARFKHSPRATDTALAGDRTFSFKVEGVEVVAPYTPSFASIWRRASVVLTIRYREDAESESLDAVVMSDFAAIAFKLLDPQLWVQSTSGIRLIGSGAPELLPSAVEDVQGARLLRVSLVVEFRTLEATP